jgi:hypothetical protein
VNAPAFVYDPPGEIARSFLRSNAFLRGIMGPFGSGKSTACVMDILKIANSQAPASDGVRYTRHAAIRNTYAELRTTTMKTWHQWIPQSLGRWVDEGPPRHHIKAQGIDMEVVFLALDRPDDVKRALGLELTTAWGNEAREIPKEIIDALTGRVGRYPGANLGGCTRKGIILDTNPPDSDHWWYRMAEEVQPEGWQFFRQPSGLSERAENLNWLNQTPDTLRLPLNHPERIARGRRYYQDLAAGKSYDWIKVYIHGEYGFVRDGKPVYPEYADSIHCAKVPLTPGKGDATCGLDFGLTPAGTFSQRRPNGQIITFDELVTENMGMTNFAKLLVPALAKYPQVTWDVVGDPSGDTRSQTDEQTVFQILRANGIACRPARSNDFALRRDAVGNTMGRLVEGQPAFLLSPTCTRLRKALAGGYCYKRVQVSGERYQDKPSKDMHSHVAESQQYAFLELGENPRAVNTGKPWPGVIHPQGQPWKVFG